MHQFWRAGVALAVGLVACGSGLAQTQNQTQNQTMDQPVVNPSGQRIVVAGRPAPVPPVAEARTLNERQRALAEETDRLLSMATELKAQVDMTSKNILSIKVVRQAEEIELYARRMKGEAKR